MRKTVIVNADDLGLTEAVNAGIFDGIDTGDVTDVSLMANGEAFASAVDQLKRRNIHEVGIHCCLVDGELPVADGGRVGPLLNGAGFPRGTRPTRLFLQCLLMPGRTTKAVQVELDAQVRKIHAVGLMISHLDSHQHIHLFPGIAEITTELCREHKIPLIRIPTARGKSLSDIVFLFLASRLERLARSKGIGVVKAVGYGSGAPVSPEMIDAYLDEDFDLREIIVHPGDDDDHTHRKYSHWPNRWWAAELSGLRKSRDVFGNRDVERIDFAQAARRFAPMNCPACGGHDATVRYLLGSHTAVSCDDCGLLYNGDFLNAGPLAEVFSESYYRDVQSEGFDHVFDGERDDPSAPIYAMGMDIVESVAGTSRVLDIGCAFGSFLDIAKARGWRVAGVEPSAYSSRFARDNRGHEVFTGTLTESPYGPEEFDLVTFWDVIEHVVEVTETVRHAAGLLKPGGIMILTTDNYRSLISFIALAIYWGTFGWITYPMRRFYIRHNSCYFTRKDLDRILRKAGMDVIRVKSIDHPIDRIKLNAWESLVLRVLYGLGVATGLTSQFMLVARKK